MMKLEKELKFAAFLYIFHTTIYLTFQ